MIKKRFLNKRVILFIAFYTFPLLVLVLYGFFLIPQLKTYLKETIQFSILMVLFFTVSQFIKNKSVKNIYYRFSFIIMSFLVFIKLAFYYNFKAQLNASALYLLFETNANESKEFLSFYIDRPLIILFVLLTIVVIVFTINRKITFEYSFSKIKRVYFLVAMLIFSSVIYIKFKNENIFLKTIESYKEYKEFKKIFTNDLAKQESNYITNVSASDSEQTYVVIIGESTSRRHMQIYGYLRKTTPNLQKMKNELLIFNDVITPHTHTITALDEILTLKNLKNPNLKENASIVQLANKSGFYTYWISNQKPVGINESIPSLMGKAANKVIFTNTKDFMEVVYDSNVLPKIKKALTDTHKKKIIFIHLMGTHTAYKNRYPKEFNIFRDSKNIKSVNTSKQAIDKINQYDNANLYNDFIVSSIIQEVKKINSNSFVLYFSDHGDEVYDEINFCGHNEWRGTKSMFEIPFILWLSKKYRLHNQNYKNFKKYLNRKYLLDDFINSFADLSQIKFNKLDSTKSVFNKNFHLKKRILKNGKNYDEKVK